MRTITTTMRPDEEIQVDDAEFLDLKRQGLIHSGDDEPKQKADEDKPTRAPRVTTERNTPNA